MRYTKQNVRNRFEALARVLGKRIAADWKDVGAWKLDYNPHYGGYIIAEYMENGGETHPVFSSRLPAGQFCEAVNFAIRCIALDRPGQSPHAWNPTDKTTEA